MDSDISDKIKAFFTQYKNKTYKKGEMLVRVDEVPDGIFYLISGSVKKYAISKKGDEVVVNIFKPVSFFPMSWAINNTHNIYYYEAITDVETWIAPSEEVLDFIKREPDVLFDLLRRVYRGTDGMETRMTHLMAGNAHDRLISELLIYAKRFGNKGKNLQDPVTVVINEKDIAASSGMTRETVSREMKILKEKGLVSLKSSQLIISSLVKLEEELSA